MSNNSKTPNNTSNVFSFEALQPGLNKEGYNTYIMPVGPDNAVEQILVSTMVNTQAENQPESPVIQIMFINDLLAASKMGDASDSTYILQFFASLPFNMKNDQTLEMHQLLAVFSRVLPVGSFGLGEDGAFFRYSFLSLQRNIETELVVELVKMISFFVNKFSPLLNLFASGQKTLQEVLQDTEKELSLAV